MSLKQQFYEMGLPTLLGIGAVVVYVKFMPPLDVSLVNGLVTCALIYFIFGFMAGFIVPHFGWRAGILIAAPFWLVILFSMLFAGIWTPKIITQDIPVLLTVAASASASASLGTILAPKYFKTSGYPFDTYR